MMNLQFYKKKITYALLVYSKLVIIACAGISMLLSSCLGQVKNSREGWVGDDTYQVHASAPAPRRILPKEVRRNSAKNAAIERAQYLIIERLMGAVYEYYSSVDDYDRPSQLPRLVVGIIKGGSVVEEKYDEQDACTILYRISHPNLRSLASPPFRNR